MSPSPQPPLLLLLDVIVANLTKAATSAADEYAAPAAATSVVAVLRVVSPQAISFSLKSRIAAIDVYIIYNVVAKEML